MSKSREGEKCKAERWGVGAALAVARPTALLVTLRRGDPRGRPREGQSPSPTHPMIPCRRAGCPHLAADGLRTPCKTPCHCETSDRCHWLWQSASPVPKAPLPKGGWHGKAVTGGFFSRTPGRAHGPCPTKCCVTGTGRTGSSAPTSASVGADAHIGPPTAPLVTLRRGGVLPRPREGQSPSPTHPL